jgi:hypothetical protein
MLGGVRKVQEMSRETPFWTIVRVSVGEVPALIDTGAQFLCVRKDVIEFLREKGETCKVTSCAVTCELADESRNKVTEMLKLRIKLLSFIWDYEFKVLNESPFPVILGLDFMRHAEMSVDVKSRTFNFGFAPDSKGEFCSGNEDASKSQYGLHLRKKEIEKVDRSRAECSDVSFKTLMREFPALFSSKLGVAKCAPYEIEMSDSIPVRSAPYRCAPPKLQIFHETVNDLLEQGVTRPSKSPYASPAFLLSKRWGGFRMVVDYRKVNAKIVLDSYLMPTIDQAFEQFSGAMVFTVLDLNSAYFQIPLSDRSRRITAFCTPFGLFEFNKLPVGVSVGCQGFSRVIDELFADLKGKYIFNFLDDLIVYSSSMEKHRENVREILNRLQEAGFTLNPEKVTFGATEINYLGHKLSSNGISILPDRVSAMQNYPRPTNLRALRRFIGMVGFCARFISDYSRKTAALHALKKKGVRFIWGSEHQEAFESLKRALCEAPTLQIPDYDKAFVAMSLTPVT